MSTGRLRVRPVAIDDPTAGSRLQRVRCGQCIGCRLDRSTEWADRLMHEARQHEHAWFLTLTYDPEHLPEDAGLYKPHLQSFWRKLRRHHDVRYLAVGEYGDQVMPGDRLGRPHYHAAVYGPDLELEALNSQLSTSTAIAEAWSPPYKKFSRGIHSVAPLTWESAAYVARYALKKRNGDRHDVRYVHEPTGVVREREFLCVSTKPGIGKGYFEQFTKDVFPRDEIVTRGHRKKAPRYYLKLLEQTDPALAEAVKSERQLAAAKPHPERTVRRLRERLEYAKVHQTRVGSRSYG